MGAGVGTMLYAFVPGDVEPTGRARGVGDPPAEIRVVSGGEVAALVSDVPLDRPLGRPEDLTAYERLLDATVTVAPVVPVRFGTVLTDAEAVRQLLEGQHDNLVALLDELTDRVQFTVRGRYDERAVLTEILDEQPEARRLREEIRDRPDEETTDARVRLGEIINWAVAARRDAHIRHAIDQLTPVATRIAAHDPTHELDAVNLAVLVDRDRQDKFDEVLERLAEQWRGLVNLRLIGPLAPYDFVRPLAQEA